MQLHFVAPVLSCESIQLKCKGVYHFYLANTYLFKWNHDQHSFLMGIFLAKQSVILNNESRLDLALLFSRKQSPT
jgi:hypothetical protein